MVADVALILLGGGFAAALGLGLLLLAAPARLRIYAQPNARSFHEHPTPTSGGVIFVLPVVAYLWWLAPQGPPPVAAMAAGGTLLAAVGLWDDVREVSRLVRFLLQVVAASAVAWSMVGDSQPLLAVGVAAALVWHVNLYNFMDGIDGLAAAHALVFCIGVQVVGCGLPGWPGDTCWLVTGSVLGFLVFNWPRARMFMGDVGSYFLGLIIGALAVLLWRQGVVGWPVPLILLSGFWFDATYTLIVRCSTGQPFTRPHRSHLYQKIAAIRGHLWTTVCYLLYSAFWLLPLAWLVGRFGTADPLFGVLWVVPAVAPLAVAAWRLRAGLPEHAPTTEDA